MRSGIVFVAAALSALPCLADGPGPFPCLLLGYRVMSQVEVRFLCDKQLSTTINTTVTIRSTNVAGSSSTATLRFDDSFGEQQWIRVEGINPPLRSGQKYELLIQGFAEEVKFPFSTIADATVGIRKDVGSSPCADGSVCAVIHSNVAFEASTVNQATIGTPPQCSSLGLLSDFPNREGDGTDGVGRALIRITSAPPDNSPLCITGLQDVFGNEVSEAGKYKAPAAPKSKDTSNFFAKLLSQAGPGARPGWAADVKFSPVLSNLGRGFFLDLDLAADIGYGKVADTKTTDTAKFGMGLTKVWASRNPVARLVSLASSPRLAFETDKEGHHQNLLFDWENKLYWRGLLHSRINVRKQQHARKVLAQTPGSREIKIDEIPMPKFGWQFQTSAGTEIGAALSADTTKSSDKATSVVRPTYNIARVRPTISASVEFWRIELTLMAVPRILFLRELVTSERDIPKLGDSTKTIKEIYLRDAQGFRPYGEASVNFMIDRDGHALLSSTYKLGSVPPNFDKVNTVQTGFLIRF